MVGFLGRRGERGRRLSEDLCFEDEDVESQELSGARMASREKKVGRSAWRFEGGEGEGGGGELTFGCERASVARAVEGFLKKREKPR